MSVDPKNIVIFEKSIVLSAKEGTAQTDNGSQGQLRFNNTTLKFEGYHSNAGADIFGNIWRPLTQDVASSSNLGIIRVGSNLTINPTTGLLSSIASGVSRIYQLVITVSPIPGAGDYQTINDAISNAIGTPGGGYIDGSLTSNLGSPPSPIYPFVIQLGPGQYSETLNNILLPDYVSLRGEDNYNSVITQNAGSNSNVAAGSMIEIGQNCEIRNLVITLAANNNSVHETAIYSLNKSNVSINECIFNSSTTNTSLLSYIYMIGGNNNTITNNKFLTTNITNASAHFYGLYIENTIPRIINNIIDIPTSLANLNYGIYLNNCNGLESVVDKVYIENLTNTINYLNTTTGSYNFGIYSENSSIIIKNSEIEVANDPTITTNYGISFESSNISTETTSSNIISFISNTTGSINNTINSSDISQVNFITLKYQRGQYVSVSDSTNNDGVYRIDSVNSDTITLDTGFNVINEAATLSNTITLKALYTIDIEHSKINASTNTIKNWVGTDNNHIFNINNSILQGGPLSIKPSYLFTTNYKTLTVGKVNCDFNSLGSALFSITDSNINTRYLIKVESGIYEESSGIECKEYVNIEGNSPDNTILQFYSADDTNDAPTSGTSGTSCLLLASNMTIANLRINNNSTLYTAGLTTTTVLYNPNSISNVIFENICINSECASVYNYGMYLDNTSNITIRNANIIVKSNIAGAEYNIGIYSSNCSGSENNFYNVSSTINNSLSNYNYSIWLSDSDVNIYNPLFIAYNGGIDNFGIKSEKTNTNQSLCQIYNGQIRGNGGIDYSISADDYYTFICNGVQLLGGTYTSASSSLIFCNGCYTFNDTTTTDKLNAQSLNIRGENEQALGTLTIGDTAGKLGSNGSDNVLIGVGAGTNITSGSNNTILGSTAGNELTSAERNTLIGMCAGQHITIGERNTITGAYAGQSLIEGSDNVITGSGAGMLLTTGNLNTFIGKSSASSLISGNENTFIGCDSGTNSTTANTNTFVGTSSGNNNQTGSNNTYLGHGSGFANNSGSNNVLIGSNSGFNNNSSNIVAVGNNAGCNNISSINNTYIGHYSGYYNTTGDCNTFVGKNSGYGTYGISGASGVANTAIGNEAGFSISSGSRNTLIGSTSSDGTNDAAGWSLTTGQDNVQIGVKSGSLATSAINNVIIGSSVGTSIVGAGNNVLIGKDTGKGLINNGSSVIIGSGAGDVNTAGNAIMIGYKAGSGYTGSEGFAIGYNAGANITGDFNTFIGYNSGGLPKITTTGPYNLAIGPYTGFNLSSGARNTIIGSGDSSGSAGRQLNTGSDNTLLGFKAGNALQAGNSNTLIGSNAAPNLTSGAENLVLGYSSAFNLNSGSYNVVLGPEAGYNLNTGAANIYAGYQAGYNNISGGDNINIGVQSGFQSTNNNFNIHMGYQAGYKSQASNNLFLGYQSGVNNTLGTNNIFIGSETGAGINGNTRQTGDNNIFMGTTAGNANDNGYRNIFMGYQAGKNSIDGSKNIFIGENTGSTSSTSHNIFIGTSSDDAKGVGYLATGTGDHNVFVGHDVGIANTVGKDNIFMGDKAGRSNTTGDQNIYIGTSAGQNANDNNANYNIAIGASAGIYNQSGYENILIGKNVGGYSNAPSTDFKKNIIIGSEAGQNIQQDNQIFIGTDAGKNNTTGNQNIFIGLEAGASNIDSNDNVIIGSNAGISMYGTGGVGANTIIGSQAGKDLTTGINNIYMGSGAGASAVTSVNNVVLGSNAMSSGDSSNLIIIGYQAGQNNSADGNLFIGSEAGQNNTVGEHNLAIGFQALKNNASGSDNICIGELAGQKNTTNNNVYVGSGAGTNNTTGVANIAIGKSALNKNNGDKNIAIGYESLTKQDLDSYYNIAIGYQTLYNNRSSFYRYQGGNANIAIGVEALFNNLSGDGNIAIGYRTLYQNLTGAQNLAIGSNALLSLNGYQNQFNMAIGENAGRNLQSGGSNIYIGYNSGLYAINCIENICIGIDAAHNNQIGSFNVNIGRSAGYFNTTGENVSIGAFAGFGFKYGNYNVYIGPYAGQGRDGNLIPNNDTQNNNIGIGLQALYNITTADTNLALGSKSLFSLTTGNNNIAIGLNAGYSNITGEKNNFIGYKTGFNSLTNNSTYLGNLVGQNNNGANNFFMGYETIDNAGSGILTTFTNKFAIYQSATSGITANTSVNCNILLGGDFSTGTVGIGTLEPDSFVSGSMGSYTSTKLVVVGKVLANSYTTFTGSHKINLSPTISPDTLIEGMCMSSTGVTQFQDINNTVVTAKLSITTNDKTIYGVYCGSETITTNDTVSNSNISTTVYYVNSLGEGGILVSNYTGEVQNGDYITTCPIAGYGALQADDIMHSYTVAKCTQTIDWSSVAENITLDGVKYKSLLVACTYHCG